LAEQERDKENLAQGSNDDPGESAETTEKVGPSAGERGETVSAGAEETPAPERAEETAGAEEEEEKVEYEIVEEKPRPGSVVDLKFKVPYKEYERKVNETFKELRRNVIIDGFRKGKAPLKLIQNRYRKEVERETLDFLAENTLLQIGKEKNQRIIRHFDRVDPEVVEGRDLVFSISLEVEPKIDPVGYDDIEITVDVHEIDDAAVEEEIQRIRDQAATFETVEGIPYQPTFGVVIDIKVTDDKGNEIKELTREGLFLSRPEISLPEPVAAELRGKRPGESFTATVENERRSEGGIVTSQHDRYYVKIREVRRKVLPELNDEFVRDVSGFETLDELRREIRKQLQVREDERFRDEALEKIYEILFARNPFDLPQTLLGQTQAELLRQHLTELRLLGLSLEDLGEDPKEYILRSKGAAEKLLRIFLLEKAIAEKENITPTDEDINRAIEKRAEREGRRPLAIRARLEARREMDRFRDDVRYEMVRDFLLSRAKINKQKAPRKPKIATPGSG